MCVFLINKHYLVFRCLFCRKKKTPEGTAPASTRGLEASNHLVWSHPITLRSLVVRSTALTQGGGWVGGVHFQKIQFLIISDITSQSQI